VKYQSGNKLAISLQQLQPATAAMAQRCTISCSYKAYLHVLQRLAGCWRLQLRLRWLAAAAHWDQAYKHLSGLGL